MTRDLALVVFDMAGTTVLDDGHVPAAFTAALAEHGVIVTADHLSAVRGASKREAIARFLTEGPARAARAAAAYETFRARLGDAYRSSGVRPVAGAQRAFERLRARGIRVALNTGFDRELTDLLLDALGWRHDVVDAVICGDDVPAGRPAPYLIFRAMEATRTTHVRTVANVGDTTLDLEAGQNAGVGWNIGVLSGAHTRAQLERAPHTHLIDSVADLDGPVFGW